MLACRFARGCDGCLTVRSFVLPISRWQQCAKTLDVGNQQTIALERLDKPFTAKLFHRARHRFARRADLVRELLLRPIELDLHAVRRLDAYSLRVANQLHGKARGDIAECQCLGEVHEMTQAPAKRANDGVRDVGLVSIQKLECGARQKDQVAVLDRNGGRRVGAAVEHRKLGHGSPGPFDMEHLLASGVIGSIDPNAARLDHVQAATLLARREQHATRGKGLGDTPPRELLQRVIVKLREQWNGVQERDEWRALGGVRHIEGITPCRARVTTVTRWRRGPREILIRSGERTMPNDATVARNPRFATTWTALATVIDPELGLDIVTLGLVYGVEIDGSFARITYTLTTAGCPMERVITDGIRRAVLAVEGIARVDTHVVWEPAWHSGMIAPGAFPT